MSERFETKRCIKGLYKYSPFPFLSLLFLHSFISMLSVDSRAAANSTVHWITGDARLHFCPSAYLFLCVCKRVCGGRAACAQQKSINGGSLLSEQ